MDRRKRTQALWQQYQSITLVFGSTKITRNTNGQKTALVLTPKQEGCLGASISQEHSDTTSGASLCHCRNLGRYL